MNECQLDIGAATTTTTRYRASVCVCVSSMLRTRIGLQHKQEYSMQIILLNLKHEWFLNDYFCYGSLFGVRHYEKRANFEFA